MGIAGAPPAHATGPTALGVSGWEVYGSTAVYANPVASTQTHGTPGQYAAAPAVPAQDDAGWADCGPSSPLRSSPYRSQPNPLCPNASTIGMNVGSILPGCWSQLNFTYFQALVGIPANTNVTQFSVNMSGADDGARISLVNSQYPNGVTPPGGFIYQLTGQTTGDLSAYVVAGEVNRVVITQVDDCAVGNNLGSAQVFLNGSVVPVDGDGDGVPDATDNCDSAANADQLNTDGDAEGDACDGDDDNDGTPDGADAFPKDGSESADADGDGTGNNADLDDDNDGTPDTSDVFPNDPSESADNDGDGTGDNADLDDDNDGTPDTSDVFPTDPAESVDTDGDGTGNNADDDDDGDDVSDADDVFPTDPSESADADGDGTGDNADLDDDNDDVNDVDDAFPTDPTESIDTDGDGTGNNADPDDDGDGVSDGSDAFPLDPTESVDTDGDGSGNNSDPDDDDDGVSDGVDDFPLDPSESVDTDGDGTGNNADPDDDADGLADADEPGAGTNPLDPDTDDDGVLDGDDTLPLDPQVGTEAANAAGICSVVQRLATKHGAAVSLCNHLNKAQKEADKGNVRGFNQAMSTFDKELTAQTNGRNAAFTAANAATVRALVALWTP